MDAHRQLWQRYQQRLWHAPELGMRIDVSRMDFPESLFTELNRPMQRAFESMRALEAGDIANPDEQRRVGHYWLRAPERAPDAETAAAIRDALERLRGFAHQIRSGELTPSTGGRFTDMLLIGIGGSALGPQLLADALEGAADGLTPHFMDNTDPDGMHRILAHLDARLASTLVLVVSKSGGTPETANGLRVTQAAYARAGMDFASNAVAVTAPGSKLHTEAQEHNWLASFPIWDWVGGRTSITSPVGLLPAALLGLDVQAFLDGAARCDVLTRNAEPHQNPAALLAAMWYYAAGGQGHRDMVVLPYSDKLGLLGRYLQQLVMESLGKKHDLQGHIVHQGLTVYGNKGSTDQHAYVQQLREGVDNFFVTFIEVASYGHDTFRVAEPDVTCGDYLRAFLLGTREALHEAGRESLTITLPRIDAFSLGALIALYERTVGLYAGLVGINAYHQPGVEAGKRTARQIIDLQTRAVAALGAASQPLTVEQLAESLGNPEAAEVLYHLLEGLVANNRGILRHGEPHPSRARYARQASAEDSAP